MNCYCCSGKNFSECCQPYLEGKLVPSSPEALMRSRYTAYSIADIFYIQKTMHGRAAIGFKADETRFWAKRVKWIKLEVRQVEFENPDKGFVEFLASMIEGSYLSIMHEKSEFIREHGQWYYVDGMQFPRTKQLISRNLPCPCGSQRKFKNCHGEK